MATTVFVSPGVYTREQDFSVFASRVGITKLGLVGLTLKGPAFEPIKIKSFDEFVARFGSTNVNFEMPYVANAFLKQSGELTITRVLGNEGFANSAAWIIQASGGSKSGAVLAVLRSKSTNFGDTFLATQASDIKISGIEGTLNSFNLSGSTGPLTALTNGLTVCLDETKDNYIVKVLGKNPKKSENDYGIYVESIYPHFVREATSRGEITNIQSAITFSTEAAYTDYQNKYTNPITPWIVSKSMGGTVKNLFQFESISDGDSANKEIKISITNIDDVTKTFDVVIRKFNDTDSDGGLSALERFRNVTLDSTQPNYIAKVIGTTDEEFERRSLFVTINLAHNHPEDTVPAGFKGYDVRNTTISGTTGPEIFYKTTYFSGDSVFKTFLGISELAYSANTASKVGTVKGITTLEVDLFAFNGAVTTGITTTKGFHLESTASSSDFVTGDKVLSAYTKSERKFTLVPAGGFDGWNKFETIPSFTSAAGDLNNVEAMKKGLDIMSNPEEVDVNLFAVPGINYKDNEGLVKHALSIVEDRADSLYIMDSPRLTDSSAKGTADEAVSSLLDTGIDSNYAATYWPWIQIEDAFANKNVYVSPTSEVVRAIAFTDNVSFPWFAPAGINRGLASNVVKKADIKLKKEDRDTLQVGRINPIATLVQQGVVIYGQKTLQLKQSSLDRVNVRRLLLQVRRLIAAASQTLLFEQNDQTLRDQFLAKVEPILLQIKNQRGLNEFKIVLSSVEQAVGNDKNTLSGNIMIQPTEVAEYISMEFSVFPTGANFSDF